MVLSRQTAISQGVPKERRIGDRTWDLDSAASTKKQADGIALKIRGEGEYKAIIRRVAPSLYGIYVRLSYRGR